MVFTKSELIASLQHEVHILLHLAGKIDRAMLDYRPTPKQRSTLELLKYLSYMMKPPAGATLAYTSSSSCPSMFNGLSIRTARSVAPPFSSRVMTAGATGGGGPSSAVASFRADAELAGADAACCRDVWGPAAAARDTGSGVKHRSATAMNAGRTLMVYEGP